MAQQLEQTHSQADVPLPGEKKSPFTFNPQDPEKSVFCDPVKQTCEQMSVTEFHQNHRQEYDEFVKTHPELKAVMDKFDQSNEAIQGLPRYSNLNDLMMDTPLLKRTRERAKPEGPESPEGGVETPIVPGSGSRSRGVTLPILREDGQMGPPERDFSVPQLRLDGRQLRIEPGGQLRFDAGDGLAPPGCLSLDPAGSVILDSKGQLHFDPTRRQEFEAQNRHQLRLPGEARDYRDGYDARDATTWMNPSAGNRGRERDLVFDDPFKQRNPLEALLDPSGRNRNSSLDALLNPNSRSRNPLELLDPLNSRRRDPFGQDSLNGQDSLLGPNFRLKLPGQPANGEFRLEDYGSIQELRARFAARGVEGLPPEVQKQIGDQMMKRMMQQQQIVLEPVVTPEIPVEQPVAKPVEEPIKEPIAKPVEVVKPAEPVTPIDGPQGPTDLERPTPVETPVEAKDNAEKLDAFGQSIKDTGAFTIDNFGEAYKAAAQAEGGVAIVVVGRGIPGSEEAIKNVQKLQAENPKLKFLVVDRDKVDANVKADPNNAKMKEWQNWIDTSIKACGGNETNKVLTSIQSLKADSTGYPAPEKVTSFHWNSNINQEVAAKASLAIEATASHTKEFRLTMNSESAKALSDQIKATREAALQMPVTDAASWKARQDKFVQALQEASQARPDLLAQRRKEIAAIQDKAVRDKELQTLNELENAPLLLRAELGLDMVRSASSLSKPEKQAAMMAAGLAVLKDAYKSAPELKGNQAFGDELKKVGVNVEQLIKDSEKAASVSADQIKDKIAQAHTAGDPVKVTEKRTEYTSNLSQGTCDRMRCNSGACYNQECIRQKCCTPGGICRRFGRRR